MNDFSDAIAAAAQDAANYDPDALPEGLTQAERKKHLLGLLRTCAVENDRDREDRIRARYPDETTAMRTQVQRPVVRAWEAKSAEYYAGLAGLVRRWLTVPGALDSTAKADIRWLNDQAGSNTYPEKLLSRPQSKKVMENLADATLGDAKLPPECKTLAHLKKAIRAAQFNNAAGATPFGAIAKIVQGELIGRKAVKIGKNGNRAAIRVEIDGKRLWLRLDVFEAGLEAIGYGAALDTRVQTSPDGESSRDSMVMNEVNNLSWENGLTLPCQSAGEPDD